MAAQADDEKRFASRIAVLGFIFLFKISEAFLGRMSLVFYKEIGFSKSDIALYSRGPGWIITVAFSILGGLFAIRIDLVKAMFIPCIAMALANLLFAAAVVVDDLTGAFVAVTSSPSSQCSSTGPVRPRNTRSWPRSPPSEGRSSPLRPASSWTGWKETGTPSSLSRP